MIDHSKHLSQQADIFKIQLESESEYNSNQKAFYEKELNKFKNSHQEEIEFLKQSYEIQIQRLNGTYNSQITRLQERLAQTEEESEKVYIQSHQLREKSLQIDKKAASEIEKIEENYKKDIKNNEETIRLLRYEVSTKDSELKSIQENLGAWKARCEQYSEETKKLRIGLQEAEIQINSLRSEINKIKENNHLDQDNLLRRIVEEYDRKIKELNDDLEFAKAKAGISQAEKMFKKSDDFPKLWSEDLGPASSVRSNNSQNRNNLLYENDELKKIIEQMRKDMEVISQNALQNPEETEKFKVLVFKLRNELVKITAERDQLLEISSELRAELRMISNNPQYLEKDLAGQISHIQQSINQNEFRSSQMEKINNYDNFQDPLKQYGKNIPKYEDFEDIMNQEPEKEEKAEFSRKNVPAVNSNRETASQKEVHDRFRANLKKTKKPLARNYNIKE